jgi:2-polyprenyl-6-methoxyphenol hydroxylase-like FAD-dependent oxidoreductase
MSDLNMTKERTQVIICGGGPTGALLSALLGLAQVPNVVLEREADINTDPRGIALDEDGIRILQSIGVYDRIFTEIGTGMISLLSRKNAPADFHRHAKIQFHQWIRRRLVKATSSIGRLQYQ